MSAERTPVSPPPPRLEVLRAVDRTARPWRNGGGITREIARSPTTSPADDFDWRLSVAEVSADGPFSGFEGVRRTIVLIAGAGLTLTIDGTDHVLGLYQPLTFDGRSRTSCTLPAGPTRDLNLMTTIGRAAGTVEVAELDPGEPMDVPGGCTLVLILLAGNVGVSPPDGPELALGPLDALRWDDAGQLRVTGSGVIAVVRIEAA